MVVCQCRNDLAVTAFTSAAEQSTAMAMMQRYVYSDHTHSLGAPNISHAGCLSCNNYPRVVVTSAATAASPRERCQRG